MLQKETNQTVAVLTGVNPKTVELRLQTLTLKEHVQPTFACTDETTSPNHTKVLHAHAAPSPHAYMHEVVGVLTQGGQSSHQAAKDSWHACTQHRIHPRKQKNYSGQGTTPVFAMAAA